MFWLADLDAILNVETSNKELASTDSVSFKASASPLDSVLRSWILYFIRESDCLEMLLLFWIMVKVEDEEDEWVGR
jgi:hypothetical protein